MKIQITFKDPDCVFDAVKDAVCEKVKQIEGLSPDEIEVLIDDRMEQAMDDCEKFIKYGEYVTIEIDTETQTATVISNY